MGKPDAGTLKLRWDVILHMTFVVAALLLGILDKIAFAAHREH